MMYFENTLLDRLVCRWDRAGLKVGAEPTYATRPRLLDTQS